jgi:short-subunit dehydrogenase
MQISGSTVLLTGATGGLGQAIARALHARGARLVLTGRRAEVLDALAAQLDARALDVDLADAPALTRLARDAGEVDILVANAGLPASGLLDTFTVEQIDRALDVNLRAPIVLARELAPAMVDRGRGHLVFMGSLQSKAPTPGAALYNATKYGLRGFASALRGDLRATGVGVSAIFPGFIRDAGLFADTGASLPPGVGTRSPEDVARALIGAVERNRGEVDVAPLALRAGTIIAGLAPELGASVQRRLGSERITREVTAAQREKR